MRSSRAVGEGVPPDHGPWFEPTPGSGASLAIVAPSSLLRSAVVSIAIAVVAVVIVYFIADAVDGPLLVTPPGGDAPEELPIPPAVLGTVVGGIVGAGLAVLSRRFAKPEQVFVGICIVALVLYGAFSISSADTTAAGVWLNAMHLAAAVPIVGLLTRWLQVGRGQTT